MKTIHLVLFENKSGITLLLFCIGRIEKGISCNHQDFWKIRLKIHFKIIDESSGEKYLIQLFLMLLSSSIFSMLELAFIVQGQSNEVGMFKKDISSNHDLENEK